MGSLGGCARPLPTRERARDPPSSPASCSSRVLTGAGPAGHSSIGPHDDEPYASKCRSRVLPPVSCSKTHLLAHPRELDRATGAASMHARVGGVSSCRRPGGGCDRNIGCCLFAAAREWCVLHGESETLVEILANRRSIGQLREGFWRLAVDDRRSALSRERWEAAASMSFTRRP